MAGTRTEDARRFNRLYDNRLSNGLEWDLIKFTNGDHVGAPVHWVLWLSTEIVPSYRVTAPNGTVYDLNEPHYVVHFANF